MEMNIKNNKRVVPLKVKLKTHKTSLPEGWVPKFGIEDHIRGEEGQHKLFLDQVQIIGNIAEV